MPKSLSSEQWAEIGRRYTVGREQAKLLALEFGVSTSTIYKRAARANWATPDDGLRSLKDLNATVERLERIVSRFEAGLSVRSSHES